MPLSPHLAVTYTAYATSFLAFISSNQQRKEIIRKIGSVLEKNFALKLKAVYKLSLTTVAFKPVASSWYGILLSNAYFKIKDMNSKNLISLTLEHFEVPAVKIFMKIYITFWILRIKILQSVAISFIRILHLTSVYQQILKISILDLRIEPFL